MRTLPAELLNLIVVFQPLFTKASWEHAKALLLGALPHSWQTRGHGLSARRKRLQGRKRTPRLPGASLSTISLRVWRA
jgi:hypothetical protein